MDLSSTTFMIAIAMVFVAIYLTYQKMDLNLLVMV